jgi:hypothetical protein
MIANRRTREPLSFRRGVGGACHTASTDPALEQGIAQSAPGQPRNNLLPGQLASMQHWSTVAVAQDGLTAPAFRLNERCG